MAGRASSCALVVAAALSTGAQAPGQVAFNVIAEDQPFPWWLKAHDLSADGRVIVGQLSRETGSTAFRWSAETSLTIFEPAFEENVQVPLMMATSVSGDGSVLAGVTRDDRLFRWTADQGATVHPVLDDNWRVISAHMSDDGTVIVGDVAFLTINLPYRWTENTGAALLPPYTLGGYRDVTNLSGDGRVVVGYATCAPSDVPWMWSEGTGYRILPTPEGMGRAYGVSFDGSVIVGQAGCFSCARAVRWTAPLYEMEFLPEPASGPAESRAWNCSADGSTVVGWSGTGRGKATAWRSGEPATGVADMLLADFGVDVAPHLLASAHHVSADGRIIAGDLRGPDGLLDPWIARVDPSGECPCNFDQTSPAVTVLDLLAFLNSWFAGSSAADYNADAATDVYDLLDFLDCWFRVTATAPC